MDKSVRIDFSLGATLGYPKYDFRSLALDFEMSDPSKSMPPSEKHTSLCIGTTQIETSVTSGRIWYVWGYNNFIRWRRAELCVPTSKKAALFFARFQLLRPGVAVELQNGFSDGATFDDRTGWLKIGRGHFHDTAIEFATDTIASISDGEITGLWVRPRNTSEICAALSAEAG